jgi:hypothetical protein
VVTLANKILTGTTYYSEIQGRLGVDASILPIADIDAPSVLSIAEAKVIASVSDYATLVGDDKSYLYAAAICMVAAILAPSMTARVKKSKKDYDFQFENNPENWRLRSTELVDESYSYINMISTQAIKELPQMGAAGPTRANTPRVKPSIGDSDTTLWNI